MMKHVKSEQKFWGMRKALQAWKKIYELYEKIYNDTNLQIIFFSSIVVIGAILLIFREPYRRKSSIDFDPYAILKLKKDATKLDIRSAFRKLSLQYHPDRNPDEEKRKIYIKMNLAKDILLDEKKRKNLDEFGSIEGNPFEFEEEFYPMLIFAPGKKFLAYLFLILVPVVLAPIATITFIPWMQDPPQVITEFIDEKLSVAEELFNSNHQDEKFFEALQDAEKLWEGLVAEFPDYKNSVWDVIFQFRISSRKIQHFLVSGSDKDLDNALVAAKDVKRRYKGKDNILKQGIVQTFIGPQIKDVLSACEPHGNDKKVKNIREKILKFKKK